ncbi:GIDE domain-containing protein [Haloarcula salina]|uniref:GIDE domain-containing protein n=1 Tax=Haloarcula salina TaxID=1429914 RepID=UPI003C6FF153
MVLPQLVGLVILAVGGYLLVGGGRELRTVFHVLRNDPVPIRELDGYTGPVEITGTAVADEDAGTVTSPFTGSECLAYTYEVEELRSSGKHSNWETLDQGQAGVDFVVDDGSDRVRVNPDGADVRFESHSVTVPPGTELPDRLAEYVERTPGVDAQDGTVNLLVTELSVGNRQRFTERRLDAGEQVYVYGLARRGPATEWGSNLVDAVVGDGDGTPVFVISDTSERGTAWRVARGGLWRAALGALVAGFGLLFLLSVAW